MITMYEIKPGSPETVTTSSITSGDTTIPLNDITTAPTAPNLMSLVNSDNTDFETVQYSGTSGSNLTSVTRGVEGNQQAWSSGTSTARFIMAKDINDIQDNIEEFSIINLWGGLI